MVFGIVLGVILALVILILFCPIHVLLLYDGKITIKAGVGFLRFRVYPDRSADLLSDRLSNRKKRKILKKLLKKKERAERKKEKSLQKGKKVGSTRTVGDTLKKRKSKGIVGDLRRLMRVIGILSRKFGKKLHIKIKRLDLVAASEDAAKTAYLFGVLSQVAAYSLAAADRYTNVTFRNRHVNVRADFLGETIRADAEILFRIRVGSLVKLALSAVWLFAKESFAQNTSALSLRDLTGEADAEQNDQNEKGIIA